MHLTHELACRYVNEICIYYYQNINSLQDWLGLSTLTPTIDYSLMNIETNINSIMNIKEKLRVEFREN
jgi:hypothetical protein